MNQIFSFETTTGGAKKITQENYQFVGWLFHLTEKRASASEKGETVLNLVFVDECLETFVVERKTNLSLYAYIPRENLHATKEFILKRYGYGIVAIKEEEKIDLTDKSYLNGSLKLYCKITFNKKSCLQRFVADTKKSNKTRKSSLGKQLLQTKSEEDTEVLLENVLEVCEYDIDPVTRFCIDGGVQIGFWYKVVKESGVEFLEKLPKEDRPDLRILAFDIECHKEPLRFPDPEKDEVVLISLTDEQLRTSLISNRTRVASEIHNFEYLAKDGEVHSTVAVYNEMNERMLLERFYALIVAYRPQILVTFNGDGFDIAYLQRRTEKVFRNSELFGTKTGLVNKGGGFTGEHLLHLDCFYWVKRDSYLPQGSQGLKSVTKHKLGYEPEEIDPEEMEFYAKSHSQKFGEYCVSDSVATLLLYQKLVHAFTFSVASVLPLNCDQVLRKGSGYLCESLLMANAAKANIVIPNKSVSEHASFYKGHLLEFETYVGGHVEALESGMFRTDFEYTFRIDKDYLVKDVVGKIDSYFAFLLEHVLKCSEQDVVALEDGRKVLAETLTKFASAENSQLLARPRIYHLDVGAMYPNIILTNKLQPTSIVDSTVCKSHSLLDGPRCKRELPWDWRGKHFTLTKVELESVAAQFGLLANKQSKELMERAKNYSHKIHGKTTETVVEERTAVVCQRENPFYVDTVRKFRDARYVYKKLCKEALEKTRENNDPAAKKHFAKLASTYDSLQLAHKCILNSFYGYVMRKGSRWFSLEMAAVTTKVGSGIIKDARRFIEKVGRPLELDTDGIWCMLPESLPDTLVFQVGDKTVSVNFVCSFLNFLVREKYSNHQYLESNDANKSWHNKTVCELAFELDGPYAGMFLPSALDEGKELKKRYVVLNLDGSQAELKGFEIKRRGELEIVKLLQRGFFGGLSEGSSLKELYKQLATRCMKWFRLLTSRGAGCSEEELLSLLTEMRFMSQDVNKYGSQKSNTITTVRRLGQLFGEEYAMNRGVMVSFLITKEPSGMLTSERAIPAQVFRVGENEKQRKLAEWTKSRTEKTLVLADVLDWEYYEKRVAKLILKILCIPAVMQGLENPFPEIALPDWVYKKLSARKKEKVVQPLLENFGIVKKLENVQTNTTKIPFSNEKTNHFIEQLKVTAGKVQTLFENFYRLGDFAKKRTWLKQTLAFWRLLAEQRKYKKLAGVEIKEFPKTASFGKKTFAKLKHSFEEYLRKGKSFEVTKVESSAADLTKLRVTAVLHESGMKGNFVLHDAFSVFLKTNTKLDPTKFKKVEKELTDASNNYKFVYSVPCKEKDFDVFATTLEQELQENEVWAFTFPKRLEEAIRATNMRLVVEKGSGLRFRNGVEKRLSVCELERTVKSVPQTFFAENRGHFVYRLETKNLDFVAIFIDIKGAFVGKTDLLVKTFFRDKKGSRTDFPSLKTSVQKTFSSIPGCEQTTVEETKSVFDAASEDSFKNRVSGELEHQSKDAIFLVETNATKKFQKDFTTPKESLLFRLFSSSDEAAELSAVGWAQQLLVLVTTALKVFLTSNSFLTLESLSVFSGIPISEMKKFSVARCLDILFLRFLNRNGVLKEMHETETEERCLDFEAVSKPLPAFSYPGFYKELCLEFSVGNLEMAALLSKNALKQAEENTNVLLFVRFAASLYKNLLSVKTNNPEAAKAVLSNFVHWARASPTVEDKKAVATFVKQSAVKLFVELVSRLKDKFKLVHASFDKLVMAAKTKESVEELQQKVSEEVLDDPLFSLVQFVPTRRFSVLLFKNTKNYSGLVAEQTFFAEWQDELLFPEPFRKYFRVIVNLYVQRGAGLEKEGAVGELVGNEIAAKLMKVVCSLASIDSEKTFVCAASDITGELSQLSSEPLQRRKKVRSISTETLEVLMPSLSASQSVSREKPKTLCTGIGVKEGVGIMVKQTCKLLGLKGGNSREARKLENMAIKLLSSQEETEKNTPNSSKKNKETKNKVLFTSGLLCRLCGYFVVEDVFSVFAEKGLKCNNCSQPVFKEELERFLDNFVEDSVAIYQNQDCKCADCEAPRELLFKDYCECSSEKFELTEITKDALLSAFAVTRILAKNFGLETLSNKIVSYVKVLE